MYKIDYNSEIIKNIIMYYWNLLGPCYNVQSLKPVYKFIKIKL